MADGERRLRRAARVILLDRANRVLLFRYTAPEYEPFWILPGGECDPGEGFPAAASRELFEETGLSRRPEALGIVRQADYIYAGEAVRSTEHFFHCSCDGQGIDTSHHTELERRVMLRHRWFHAAELGGWKETIYPLDLAEIMIRVIETRNRATSHPPHSSSLN